MHIFPVKPNHGPHQDLCSPQGYGPVKMKRTSIRDVLLAVGAAPMILGLALTAFPVPAAAQEPQPAAEAQPSQAIENIRVIGNPFIGPLTHISQVFRPN